MKILFSDARARLTTWPQGLKVPRRHHGPPGEKSEKINLSFTSTYSISKNTAFPDYPNGPDYALWHNKARQLDGLAVDYSPSDIDKIKNGDPDGILGNTEWTKLIFEPFAPQSYQNLNINGGSNKLKFFNNVARLHQDGIINGVSFDRINLRSNVEYEVNSNFSVALNIAGRVEEIYNLVIKNGRS